MILPEVLTPVFTAFMGGISPGSVFAGHRIEAVAGRGGMGVVYRARQLSLDRVVALKVIAPALMEDPAIRRRFVRESKVAASIDHPNVIPIYYTGEEGGVAFIAMRYVDGNDLRTLVRSDGRLPPERAAQIVAQLAAALDASHAAGLVHRDVKPANVLLAPGDHVYLTDFGLTKHVLSEAGATRPGQWVGTLDFVAPEQIRGERIDARADVYSLGCLLHYALTGRAPFARATDEAKLWAHLSEPPPSVSEAVPGIPGAFEAVVRRALAKAPDERYQSAGDLGHAALAAARGEAARDGERLVAVGAAAPVEIETRTAATRLDGLEARPVAAVPERGGVRRRLLAGAAAVALLAAGAAAATLLGSRATGIPVASTRSPGPAGPSVTATVRVGGRPSAVAVAGGRIWVGSFLGARLTAVDPLAARAVPGLRPHVGVGLQQLAAGGSTLWALISRSRKLLRFDARTGRAIGPPITAPPDATAFTASPSTLWVAARVQNSRGGDALYRMDAHSGRVEGRYRVRDSILHMVTARGALWMISPRPATLVRLDLSTARQRPLLLGGSRPGDLAWGSGSLWVTLSDTDQLARIDPGTRNVATVAVGREPAGVAVSAGQVWVANRASSTLSRVDVATNRLASSDLVVPTNPSELVADGGALWTASLATGTVVQVRPPR